MKSMKKESRQMLVIIALLILVAFGLNNLIDISNNATHESCDEYEVVHNENPGEVIYVLTCGPEKKLWVPGYTIRRMD